MSKYSPNKDQYDIDFDEFLFSTDNFDFYASAPSHKPYCKRQWMTYDFTLENKDFINIVDQLTDEFIRDSIKGRKRKTVYDYMYYFLLNLYFCGEDTWLATPSDNNKSCTKLERDIIKWLEKYCKYYKGNKKDKLCTHLKCGKNLSKLFESIEMADDDLLLVQDLQPFKLKCKADEKKDRVLLDISPTQRDFNKYFKNTHSMNALYQELDVKLQLQVPGSNDLLPLSPPYLFRVMSDVEPTQRKCRVEDKGGRHFSRSVLTYCIDNMCLLNSFKDIEFFSPKDLLNPNTYLWCSYQRLSGSPREPYSRSMMLINGQRVTELDYGCMVPRLVYACLGKDISSDIYRCGGYSNDEWIKVRKIYKSCFLWMLYCSNDVDFIRVFNSRFKNKTSVAPKEIIKLLKES